MLTTNPIEKLFRRLLWLPPVVGVSVYIIGFIFDDRSAVTFALLGWFWSIIWIFYKGTDYLFECLHGENASFRKSHWDLEKTESFVEDNKENDIDFERMHNGIYEYSELVHPGFTILVLGSHTVIILVLFLVYKFATHS